MKHDKNIFSLMKPNKYPDRDYFWKIISTLCQDVNEQLVKDIRNHISVSKPDDNVKLVEVGQAI